MIVENDYPFLSSFPTSTATVTVNVEHVKEPPKVKVISKPKDSKVDTELVTYTATDDSFCFCFYSTLYLLLRRKMMLDHLPGLRE